MKQSGEGTVIGEDISAGDMAGVEEVFKKFDANGDGKISSSELADVVRALSGTEAASEGEIRRMMEEMDADGDGFVDLKEFVAFHGGVAGGTAVGSEKELEDAFRIYDLNGDGLISPKELHKVLKSLGDSCSLRDCSRMISSVDADGDGKVNLQEFKKMMKPPPSV
ncbi:putative calcium-binding protein CML18 [Wolffia australiana]